MGVAFVIDFAARISLATERWSYVRRHRYDIPLIALPMLRPLRVLRVLTASVATWMVSRIQHEQPMDDHHQPSVPE